MKKKIFIMCMVFLCLFLCVFGYKFFIVGNNKNIESIEQVSDYVLNIENYNIEAKVTVYSNKNSNTYMLKQYKKDGYQKQEIMDDENYGLVIENEGGKVTIKNTILDVASVFENYKEITNNSIGLDSFIDDYKSSEKVDVVEDDEYYVLNVRVMGTRNKYTENKSLYVNKRSSQIEKIEVRDVNNNTTVFIEYTRFEIL